MSKKKYFLFGMLVMPLAILGLGIANASSVSTPNTFVAGTPAIAAQVNANFAAHEAAINDNDARLDLAEPAIAANAAAASANDARLDAAESSSGFVQAWAHVDTGATPTITRWFNSRGGAPTLVKQAVGTYRVTFPGFTDMDTRAYTATLGNENAGVPLPGSIGTTPAFVSPTDTVFVSITDTGAVSTDIDFYLVIF